MRTKMTAMPLWRHLMRGLAAVWLLSGVGNPVMAESISVTSTFIPADCDGPSVPGYGITASGLCFRQSDGVVRVWDDADSYCTGLGDGYRMPTIDELSSLYNTYPDAQIGSLFGWSRGNYHWSSTLNAPPNDYKVILLNTGFVSRSLATTPYDVACVK